ncbi:MAG: hypothetical protein Q7U97_05610, partial [Rhodocyclaceae bacterium]|nr:hypothetical protein [Rhodocyclaceae bacterium]
MTSNIDLAAVRAAAQRLANAHNDTTAAAALLNAEIKSAAMPILERYAPTVDAYAAAEAKAHAVLEGMLIAAPHLFKTPRSVTVDGVRVGYKKEPDSLDWDDEAAVIARIRSLKSALAPTLIRSQESLIHAALEGLAAADLPALGIRQITGADASFITINDNDAERMVKTIIADAIKRQ